jgi:hypothetical protein
MTLPLLYWPIEPSPPIVPRSLLPGPPLPTFGVPYTPRSQVDFGWVAGPPVGITPFTVATPRSTPTTEEQERVSPTVEPLTWGTTDFTISD